MSNIKSWTPTKRQEDFIAIPDTIDEALFGGAAGGGKTETLIMLPVIKKTSEDKFLFEYPRFKALYLRRTFPELNNEVIPRTREFYPHFGFKFNSTEKRWTHSDSGAILQFGHCEHEKDAAAYDSAEYNIILWDEVTSFTQYMYEYISFSRCRSNNPFLPAIIRAGTNPGNIGHSYFRKRFVAPARDGNVVLKEKRKFTVDNKSIERETFRIYIPSKATDNTYLMQADPNYLNKLNQLPPAEKAAKLDGDWWIFSGQVFDDFRLEPLINEPSNAKHICTPFTIPYYWPKILAIDWGYSALTVALWAAINPCPNDKYPGKIYIYREYSARRKKISEWGSDIARLCQNETIVDNVMDPSAWTSRGDPYNIAEQFETASGIRIRKADKDRLGGKLLIQEYLRFNPRPAKYIPKEGFSHDEFLRLHRNYGPDKADEYYKMFQPEESEKFLPKLQIFNNCIGLIEHLPKCVYVVDSGRKSENNTDGIAEEVAELKNDTDDYYDDCRYLLKACQYYLDSGLTEYNKVEQLAKIETKLERTGNYTQYYMDLDGLNLKTVNKVRRYHGSRLRHANF